MGAEVTSFEEQMMLGRVRAGSEDFARCVQYSLAGIRQMIALCPRLYVSLSFGKQSICVAHLAQCICPDIPMFFLASSETWALYDYGTVIEAYCHRFNPCLTIVQTDRLSEADSWDEARALGNQDLQQMCPREEWDGWLWGLSFDESRGRRITLKRGVAQKDTHPTIYRYADGKYRGCPIMRWKTDDLAAYIWRHDLPLLSIYQKYGLSQRTTARLTGRAISCDAMTLARQTSGSALRDIVRRFPEVATR